MFSTSSEQWASEIFSQAQLGDLRRTKRLIVLASNLSDKLGQSLVQSSTSAADIEAAYRFTRNKAINAQAIAESGFLATAKRVNQYDCLLALEDTTSLEFKHQTVRDEMGHTSSNKHSRGMHAHSVLLFAPQQQHVVGLIEQKRWTRDVTLYGQNKHHASRAYESKESYKWEQASEAMSARLGSEMSKVISVCDREADIIEYLTYKTTHQQRFIVRSMQSRCIEQSENKLYQYSESLKSAGQRTVLVRQKGGRKEREACCQIRYARVNVKMPANKKGAAVPLYYVGCLEENNDQGLSWHLLTSEPVTCKDEAEKVLAYYEKRWLIEEFHKAWKSGGTQVEDLRMQSKDNLEKMVVILAFIAARLHQLRYLGLNKKEAEKQSCEMVFKSFSLEVVMDQARKVKTAKSSTKSLLGLH
ncbi:IS4 family transposase [Vibrio cholerae]